VNFIFLKKHAFKRFALLLIAFVALFPRQVMANSVNDFIPAWRVEPTLSFDEVRYCCCGMLVSIYGRERIPISRETGEPTGEWHDGHCCLCRPYRVYDPILGMFGDPELYVGMVRQHGMHPLSEVIEAVDSGTFLLAGLNSSVSFAFLYSLQARNP